MQNNKGQLTLMDAMLSFSNRKKLPKSIKTFESINKVVNWRALVEIVKGLDKTNTGVGGRPPISFETKLKMLFIQFSFNLSDEELEDMVIDRLSFQKFVGLSFEEEIPDFTTIWKFKEALLKHKLMDRIFNSIIRQIELNGLNLKRGTMIDATIIPSTNKPISKETRKKLEQNPSSQIDTDASSTEKNGIKYFGYKGHVGVDVDNKIIRKRTFTTASTHDSKEMDKVMSGDENEVYADKAYANDKRKRVALVIGIKYKVLEKRKKGKSLTPEQEANNKVWSKVRARVEHSFAYIKNKLKMRELGAKNIFRNGLRFDMCCILYNIQRTAFILQKA